MQQKSDISQKQQSPMRPQPCTACGEATRLAGLEPALRDASIDICTYECLSCGARHTREIARRA